MEEAANKELRRHGEPSASTSSSSRWSCYWGDVKMRFLLHVAWKGIAFWSNQHREKRKSEMSSRLATYTTAAYHTHISPSKSSLTITFIIIVYYYNRQHHYHLQGKWTWGSSKCTWVLSVSAEGSPGVLFFTPGDLMSGWFGFHCGCLIMLVKWICLSCNHRISASSCSDVWKAHWFLMTTH